tara:strand:- start:196 stop:1041 length:846 start_codon:yes stop_codon:yes gene_type:complete
LVRREHVFRFDAEDNLKNITRKPEGRLLIVVAILNALFAVALYGPANDFLYDESVASLLAVVCLLPSVVFFISAFVAGSLRLSRWVFLLMLAVANLNFLAEDGGYPWYWLGGLFFAAAYWVILMRWRAEPVYSPDRKKPTTISYVLAWVISGAIASVYIGALSAVDTSYFDVSDYVAFTLSGLFVNIVSSLFVYTLFSQLRLYLVMPYLWGFGLLGVCLTPALGLANGQFESSDAIVYATAESAALIVSHNLAFFFFFKSKGRMRREDQHANMDVQQKPTY